MKSLTRGHVKAGIDSVRGSKLRNFWTVLGVIIGVASVILVVGIGDGIKQQISDQFRQAGNDVITVRPGQLQFNGSSNADVLSLLSGVSMTGALTSQDVSTIARTPEVATAVPLSAQTAKVQGDGGTYTNGLVIGTSEALPSLLNASLSSGAFIGDYSGTGNAVVLGANVAAALFNEDVPLGLSMTIGGQSFVVAGIFNQFPDIPLSQDAEFNNAVFIDYGMAQNLSNNAASTYEILARSSNLSQTTNVARAISQRLNAAHGGQNEFSVVVQNQDINNSNPTLNLLTKLIASVAAISLLVGGIGIMNVMLVSVAERMHEIGIRKAIGATDRQILSQFMVEATMLSLAGGVIGIIISFVVDLALRLLTDVAPSISWQIVLLSLGVSLCIGITFGSIPAFKAARKDPIDALRSD
jgi:ABC-type antimicrobial peptide transport system permease subunit